MISQKTEEDQKMDNNELLTITEDGNILCKYELEETMAQISELIEKNSTIGELSVIMSILAISKIDDAERREAIYRKFRNDVEKTIATIKGKNTYNTEIPIKLNPNQISS